MPLDSATKDASSRPIRGATYHLGSFQMMLPPKSRFCGQGASDTFGKLPEIATATSNLSSSNWSKDAPVCTTHEEHQSWPSSAVLQKESKRDHEPLTGGFWWMPHQSDCCPKKWGSMATAKQIPCWYALMILDATWHHQGRVALHSSTSAFLRCQVVLLIGFGGITQPQWLWLLASACTIIYIYISYLPLHASAEIRWDPLGIQDPLGYLGLHCTLLTRNPCSHKCLSNCLDLGNAMLLAREQTRWKPRTRM